MNRRIYTTSENLRTYRDTVSALRSAEKPANNPEFAQSLKRQGIHPPDEKAVSDKKREDTFRYLMNRFGNLVKICTPGSEEERYLFEGNFISKVLEDFDIEYFYVKEGISKAGLTERDKDKNSPTNNPITTDENGHNPHHIFILKDRASGQKFFFGRDDLETLFKDEDHLIERAIISHLVQQRERGVRFHKSRLEQLEKVLLITTEPAKSDFKKRIDEIKKVDNDTFTDSDYQKSDLLISDFSVAWNNHWGALGKDSAWLEKHNLDHFLTAIKEINRPEIRKNLNVLVLLNPNPEQIKSELSFSLAFTRLGLSGLPGEISSENVELIVNSFNKLKDEQVFYSNGDEVVNGSAGKKPSIQDHPLATGKGQAALYVADTLIKKSPAPNVLNISLSSPGPLSGFLNLLSDGTPINISDICIRKGESAKPEPSDVVVANHIFHKMTDKKEEIIKAILEVRKSMNKDSTLIVTMPQQHQISKSKFGEVFLRAGFKIDHPPEIERNAATPSYHELTVNNPAAKGIVNKPFEVCTFKLDSELTDDEIRKNLNDLPKDFFITRNPIEHHDYGSREILPEYILRVNYLEALAVLNASDAAKNFIPTNSTTVTRAEIIQNHEAKFEEALAALQYFSTTEYGGMDLLTEFQKDKLAGVVNAYDDKFLPALSSTQVNFIQRTVHLTSTRIDDLPKNIQAILRANPAIHGDKCTLWDAYEAENRYRLSINQQSILDQVRPRKTLAEKIKYAFDKRLYTYKDYDRTGLPEVITSLDQESLEKATFISRLPTGLAQGINVEDHVTSNPLNFFGLNSVGVCSTLGFNPANKNSIYIFPSQLIKNEELSSYFKVNNDDQFTLRLNAFISNTRYTNQMFIPIGISAERINELANGAEPFREEVEKLALRFNVAPEVLDPYYEIRDNQPVILTPPPLPAPPNPPDKPTDNTPIDPVGPPEINTNPITLTYPLSDTKITVSPDENGNFTRREISDFVEESLATLEYANKRGNLRDTLIPRFNEIKKLWDEDFVLTLDRNKLSTLRDLINSKPKKNGLSLSELAKKVASKDTNFLVNQRNVLSERIFIAIAKKRLEVVSSFTGNPTSQEVINACNQIGKLPAQTHRENEYEQNLFSKIIISNQDHLVIAPRRLLTPEHTSQLFTDKTSTKQRVTCLSNNENYSGFGFKHLFKKFLADNYNAPPDVVQNTYSLVEGWLKSDTYDLVLSEVKNPIVVALAKFFEVKPSDIDPKLTGEQLDFPTFDLTPPTPPIDPTSTITPSSSISGDTINLTCPLTKTAISVRPNADGLYPINGMADFMEETLAVLAAIKKIDNLKRLTNEGLEMYRTVKSLWDEKFTPTFTREQIDFLNAVNEFKILDPHTNQSVQDYIAIQDCVNNNRDGLPSRIHKQWGERIQNKAKTITVPINQENAQELFSSICKKPVELHTNSKLFASYAGTEEFVIAPHGLLDVKDLTSRFSIYHNLLTRIGALSTNENLSDEGFLFSFRTFLHQEKVSNEIEILTNLSNFISSKTDKPDNKTINLLAKFFEVSPTDIDPSYKADATPTTPAATTTPITPSPFNSQGEVTLRCPLSNTTISVKPNADGLYRINGMADFMEETLALLEHENQLNRLSNENKTKFIEVKKLWDEDFTSIFTKEQIEFLFNFTNNFKIVDLNTLPPIPGKQRDFAIEFKGDEEHVSFAIVETKKEFLEKFRTSLNSRIDSLINKKTDELLKLIDQIKGSDVNENNRELCKLFSVNPKAPSESFVIGEDNYSYRTSATITFQNNTKCEVGLRRLLDPKNVIDHCPTYISPPERVQILFCNENLKPPGVGHFYGGFLSTKYPNDSYTKDFLNERITLLENNGLDYVAEFFEVSPTDIDPNYKANATTAIAATPSTPPANEDYKLIGAVSQEEVQCLLNDRDNYRPLDYMSLEDRIKLYEKLPETVNRRDLNETVLVELFLASCEHFEKENFQFNNLDWSAPYNLIHKAWDKDFHLTLTKEGREALLAFLNKIYGSIKAVNGVPLKSKSGFPEQHMVRLISSYENNSIKHNHKSSLFSRPKLQQRIIDVVYEEGGKIAPSTLRESPGIIPKITRFLKVTNCDINDPNSNDPNINESPFVISTLIKQGLYTGPSLILEPKALAKRFTLLDEQKDRVATLSNNANYSSIGFGTLVHNLSPSALNQLNKLLTREEKRVTNDALIILARILEVNPIDLVPECDLLQLPNITTPSSPTVTPVPSKSNPSKPAQIKPSEGKAKPKGIVEILIEKAFKATSEDDPLLATVRKITKNGIDSARKTPISLEELNEIIEKIKNGDIKNVSKYLAQIAGKGFGERRAESNAKEIIAAIKTRVSEA